MNVPMTKKKKKSTETISVQYFKNFTNLQNDEIFFSSFVLILIINNFFYRFFFCGGGGTTPGL